MKINSYFQGLSKDIRDLQAHEAAPNNRAALIISVAERVLAVIGLALVATGVIMGFATLISGSFGGIIPLIFSIAMGILIYDAAVILHNQSQELNPPKDPLDAVVAIGSNLKAILWDNEYPNLKGTLVIGPLVHCFSTPRW